MGDTNTSSSSALDVTADTALSEGGGANSCLPKRPFLARLTLDVSCERGGSLALVGASGSGKSTATRLLLRLVEADAGAIRVAGVPVRQICQSCLRRFVGCACAARAGDCSCWWLFKFTTLPRAYQEGQENLAEHQLLQWKRVVVHGSCASELRQSGRPARPEACLYVRIGTAINVYPVGVPGAKKLGQNSLNWGASTHISSTHRGPLDLTLEPLNDTRGHGTRTRGSALFVFSTNRRMIYRPPPAAQ